MAASAGDKIDRNLLDVITKAIRDMVSTIPETGETKSENPEAKGKVIANKAAANAALVSGGLSLPPGPLGMLTIIPDLIAIWRIQNQMVADVAGAFGKNATLTQEQMLYCLFKHAASQAVRDLLIRVGERFVVKRATLSTLQRVFQKVGLRITQRLAGRTISRLLPLIGAIGVGAYAYYDTAQVGKTAIELFREEIEIAEEESD